MKQTSSRFVPVFFVTAALSVAVFSACSGRIDGTIKADGSADLIVEASLEPRISALIRSLSAMGSGGGLVIDGQAISRIMATAPGVASVTLRNTNDAALAGTIAISHIDTFLELPTTLPVRPPLNIPTARFIQYDPAGSLVISVDRRSGPHLLALLSEEVNDYLSALMAPVSTGESLSRSEYLNLVTSIYGRPVADEIAAARILVVLEFPRAITEIKGGTYQGRRAQFSISLPDLLVLERPLVYEVYWR